MIYVNNCIILKVQCVLDVIIYVVGEVHSKI